jgi:hypothetical protein
MKGSGVVGVVVCVGYDEYKVGIQGLVLGDFLS